MVAQPLVPQSDEEITAEIDRLVIRLFARVSDAIAGATLSLLSGDRQRAEQLVDQDAEIDQWYRELDALVLQHLRASGHRATLREDLVCVLRLLPELERSADLAEHIARRATRGVGADASARTRGLVERMGEVAAAMWLMAADAYADRSPETAQRLDELDDEMDELKATLTIELATGSMMPPTIIEFTLVGRFYERLGDHAVNVTRRVPVGHPTA